MNMMSIFPAVVPSRRPNQHPTTNASPEITSEPTGTPPSPSSGSRHVTSPPRPSVCRNSDAGEGDFKNRGGWAYVGETKLIRCKDGWHLEGIN